MDAQLYCVWYDDSFYSEQEQMAANQSTTLDQTVDGETTNVMGSVIVRHTYDFSKISFRIFVS